MIDFNKLKINWNDFTYIDGCGLYKVIFGRKSRINLPEVLEDLGTLIKVTDKVQIEFELPEDKIEYVSKRLISMNLMYNDGIMNSYKLINPIYSTDKNKLTMEFDKVRYYSFFKDYTSISDRINWDTLTYTGSETDVLYDKISEFPEALNRVMIASSNDDRYIIELYPPQNVLNKIYDVIVNYKSITLINNVTNEIHELTNLKFDRINDLRNLSGTGKDLYIRINGTDYKRFIMK